MITWRAKVLFASVRGPRQFVEADKLGAHVVAVPPTCCEGCLSNPLTTPASLRSQPTGRRRGKRS